MLRTSNFLAERIWAAGVNNESARWSPQQGAGTQAARASPAGRQTGVNNSHCRKSNSKEGRLVLGGRKMKSMWRDLSGKQRNKGKG